MARMLPDVPLEQIEHGSERVVYQALREQLPDTYTVLHSYLWLRSQGNASGQALREGEVDFVILHRELGMLVLEVKGGTLKLEDCQWYREKAGGLDKIKDPFDQAARNMHALLDRIEERGGPRRYQIVYGTAVVFPHCDYIGSLPANADKAIIIGRRDFQNLEQSVNKAYAAWTSELRPLTKSQYQFIQNALLPKFKLFRPIGPDIEMATRRLFELTYEQQAVVEGIYDNPRVLVEGAAGSGKTQIALDRALSFARQGARCLFVCFNVELAKWLREQVSGDPLHADYVQRLEIWNFHALAFDLARRAEVEFKIPHHPQQQPEFWDQRVPEILEQSVAVLESKEDCRYDAIVVDEGQDFCELWWYTLTEVLLKDYDAGPLYAFYDASQSLRQTGVMPPLKFDTSFRMRINCRNTQKIARTGTKILQTDSKVLDKAPVGEAPVVLYASTPEQQKTHVLEQLRRLLNQEKILPRQIALIGPSGKSNGSLADIENIDGIALISSAEQWRQNAGILVTTARSFKGLEADIVLIYDIGHLSGLFSGSDLYVACTRARYLLMMVVHDDVTYWLIQAAID